MRRYSEFWTLIAVIFVLSAFTISCKDRLSDPQDVPRNVRMVINHDSAATGDSIIFVNISGENIFQMQISPTPDLRDADWEWYDTLRQFQPPKISGGYNIFGRFRSSSGATTGILHDSIILDYTALIYSLEIVTCSDSLTSNDSVAFILETQEPGQAFVSMGSMISGHYLEPTGGGIFRGSLTLPLFGIPNERVHVIGHFIDHVGNRARPFTNDRELVLYGSQSKPEIIRRMNLDCWNNDDLVIHDGFCYISANDWLHMVDVREPEAPELFQSFALSGWNHGIAVSDTVLAVANNLLGTILFSLRNIEDPERLGVARVESTPRDVLIDDQYAYVASYSRGLHIFDLSIGRNPKRLDRIPTTSFGEYMVQSDSIVFYAGAGGLSVFNVADPEEPEVLVEMTDFADEPKGMLYYENKLFINTDEDGLMVMDVHNPRRPYVRDTYPHLRGGRRMAIAYPYLAISRQREVTIVNISDMRSLPELTRFEYLESASGIAFNGQTLYIVTNNEMLVVDMTGS